DASLRLFFLFLLIRPPPRPTLFPYPTLFRSCTRMSLTDATISARSFSCPSAPVTEVTVCWRITLRIRSTICGSRCSTSRRVLSRSEEHTSELQSRENLVCRLLLEKKKNVLQS